MQELGKIQGNTDNINGPSIIKQDYCSLYFADCRFLFVFSHLFSASSGHIFLLDAMG